MPPLREPTEPRRGAGCAVLFVDDDEAYRYAMAKRLAEKGLQVTAVPDFTDAIRIVESEAQIDVLLCDIRMPRDTPQGFSIARMALVRRPRLRVLFITAFELPPNDGVPDSKVLPKSIGDDMIVLEVEEACAASSSGG